jgi:NAD(P)-dependent dehydrogenase (short-subunit alcohol dehydrogenase family)
MRSVRYRRDAKRAAMMVGEEDVLNQMVKEQPIGRLGRPKEIAAAGLWRCAKARTVMLWPSTAATRRG